MQPVDESNRIVHAVTGLALLATLVLSVFALRALHQTTSRPWLPLYDMAVHGLAGVRLADAIRTFNVPRFGLDLYHMAGWPPLFPILEAPVFLIGGVNYSVATTFMAAMGAAAILAAFACGLAIGGTRGVIVGAVTASLLAASPIVQQFSTVVMFEIVGLLLVLLCAATYLRWARVRTERAWSLVCLSTVLLFFLKYNYGLLWMAALVVAWWRDFGRAPVHDWLQAGWRRMRERRRFDVFLAGYIVLLVLITVTGGWQGRVAGVRISIQSIGNPLVGLVGICLIRELRHPRANWRLLRASINDLPAEPRVFARIVLIPIAVWLAAPLHMREFVNFIGNRSSGPSPWTIEGMAYYPRIFAAEYSPNIWMGWVELAAGALVIGVLPRLRAGERIIPIALGLGFLSSTLHHYKEPRFLFTVAPFVWLALGLVIARLTERPAKARAPIRSVLALAMLGAATLGFDPNAISMRHRALSMDPAVRDVLDLVTQACIGSRGTALLGTWNGLSPGLVEWQLRLEAGPLPLEKQPQGVNRFGKSLDPKALLDAIAADREVETTLILWPESERWAAAFRDENPWIEALQSAARTDPRFELRGEAATPSGYRLLRLASRKR
jgi:hypothetical protein